LLEGLEISEIRYSQIQQENRFDSEFYQKAYVANDAHLRRKAFLQISDNFYVTDGEHGSVIEQESGIKYLTAENIKKGYVDIENVRYVNNEVDRRNARARVDVGDILISIKGTLGAIGVAEDWLLPANMNRDVAILKPLDNKKLSAVTALFLMSKYGILQSTRGGSGGVQQMITLERLRKFISPIFSSQLCLRLNTAFKKTLQLRGQSQILYTQAETLLLDKLGMTNFSPSAEAINIKSFKDSFAATGRLDAEYYQPKYEDYERTVYIHSAGFTTIGAEFDLVKETSQREKSAYNYIEIGDVSVSDGAASFNHLTASALPANAKQEVRRGDLLISKVRPNRGAVAIIDFDCIDLIVSGAFTVLREKADSAFSNETLKVLLRTTMYRDWMLKFNIGTQYPVIRDDDILNLPIPCIADETQEEIAALVKESFSLKAECERLLDVAKRAVEIAIEQDESEGMAYIDANA
jgi:type I restriction enzyme S subunit